MMRWSDAWELSSLEHFTNKWDLTKRDKYFKKRYRRLGYRRHNVYLRPLVRRLSFGSYATWLEKALVSLERRLNGMIVSR